MQTADTTTPTPPAPEVGGDPRKRFHCVSCGATPFNESARLEALRGLNLLDTPPEERFDRLVRLAAKIFGAPIAYISLVDENRQWFKSKDGLALQETPRNISFCAHAILQDDVFVVENLLEDPRFCESPLVLGEPHARFYAGVPLAVEPGLKIGTFCLLDARPRIFGQRDRNVLRDLAELVIHELRLIDVIGMQEEVLRVKEELILSQRNLATEKEQSDRLLRNVLPDDIAGELKLKGKVDARSHADANVLFADFSNFSSVASTMSSKRLLAELNACFGAFDELSGEYGIEKLKTIGDAYFCVSGLRPDEVEPAAQMLRFAFAMRDVVTARLASFRELGEDYWDVRIGIHSGPLVSGVVGTRKFAFDIWGDTVNTAARFESGGGVGRINISRAFADKVSHLARIEPRGRLPIKGLGEAEMFFAEPI